MLWKAYGGNLSRAFFMMSSVGRYQRVNSKTYDKARKDYSEQVKIQMANKPNIPKFTLEHREKLRQAKLGRKLSEETKEKIRQSRLGKKMSKEFCKKVSEAKKGKSNGRLGYKQI
jgi:hypothetical protein